MVANAHLLSNDVLAKWVIEDFPFRIQLAPVFPFHGVNGHQLRYTSTEALTLKPPTDLNNSMPGDVNRLALSDRAFTFAEISTQFRIPYNAQDIFSSNVNDQTAVHMALAIRELLYKFWTLLESGDSTNSEQFDGLLKLVHPSKVIDLQHRPLTLEVLDQAKELVRVNDGRDVVIYTSSIGKRAIHAAHWIRGLPPEYEEMSVTGPDGDTKTKKGLTFDGAMVYVNDLNQVLTYGSGQSSQVISPVEAMNLSGYDPLLGTNIWFFVLGENNLCGITPASLETSMFVTRSTIVPDGSTIEYYVTMPVGVALGSLSALAVIKNATIPVMPFSEEATNQKNDLEEAQNANT